MTKVIIFDVGGVLVKKVYHSLLKEIALRYRIDYREIENFSKFSFREVMLGKINESEHFKKIIEYFNLSISINKIQQRAENLTTRIDGVWSYVKQLQGKYELIIFSNLGKEWVEMRENKFGLSKYFQKIIYSCDVGKLKPDDNFYQYLLNIIDIPPEDCILIDDKKVNIQIASKYKLNSILYRNPKQLKKELSKFNIFLQ